MRLYGIGSGQFCSLVAKLDSPVRRERAHLAALNTHPTFTPLGSVIQPDDGPSIPATIDHWTRAPHVATVQHRTRPVMGMVKREKNGSTTDQLTPRWAGGTLPVRDANRELCSVR